MVFTKRGPSENGAQRHDTEKSQSRSRLPQNCSYYAADAGINRVGFAAVAARERTRA
jgi:hypothetical protein